MIAETDEAVVFTDDGWAAFILAVDDIGLLVRGQPYVMLMTTLNGRCVYTVPTLGM